MSNSENKRYVMQRLDESKLKDIDTLYEGVYGKKPEKDYFSKKYSTAYTEAQYLGHIAYDNENNPIAFFGAIPCFIQYKEKILLAAQGADVMTHPEHRYNGFFLKLAKLTFDLCKESGINLIIGFASENSYHGCVNRLGFRMVDNMERFSIPVDTLPLGSLSKRFKWSKWIYDKYTKWVLRKYLLPQKGLLSSAISEECGGVIRSTEYFINKTYNKTQVLKAGSGKVWFKIKNGFVIGDLDLPEQDFDNVINEIKKIVKRLGITGISFQTSPGTQLHTLFIKKYSSKPSFPVIFLDLGADIPLNKLKFTFADIDIF
jgi:hypothetical protein